VQVSRNPEAAFQYAFVVINVSKVHSQLMDVVLGTFYEICPYSVPMCQPRATNESERDYKVNKLKYRCTSEQDPNVLETYENYKSRMAGLIRLFSAILVVGGVDNVKYGSGQITFQNLWVWVARLLNLKYNNKIFPHMLLVFLEQTGHFLLKQYKGQFVKILRLIETDYLNEIPTGEPDRIRLDMFVKKFHEQRTISIPEGFVFDERDEVEPNYNEHGGD